MARNLSAVNALLAALHEIIKLEPVDLVQKERLGQEFNFAEGIELFQDIFFICDNLVRISFFDKVPIDKIQRITGHLNGIIDFYKRALSFSPTNNAVQERSNILSQLDKLYRQLFDDALILVAFDFKTSDSFISHQNKIRGIQKEAETLVSDLNNIKTQTNEEINLILNNIRDASAQVGVSKHAIHFTTEANYHKVMARWWLVATVVVGLITMAWGIFGYMVLPQPGSDETETTADLIKNFSSKLIVISILSYVLVWSARNFNANRHNFVVNKHRQNALSTFETFVKAAGDDIDTKNAVLLQATSSIFSTQPTGYINKESDGSTTSSKVVEVVRTATAAMNTANKASQ